MNVPYPTAPPLIASQARGPNTRAEAGFSRVTPRGALQEISSRRPLGTNSQVPSGMFGLLISPTVSGFRLLTGDLRISSTEAPKNRANPGSPPLFAESHCQYTPSAGMMSNSWPGFKEWGLSSKTL